MAEDRYQKTENLIPDSCSLLSEALVKHREGDIGAAAQLYRAILAEHPEHTDATHMLGVIAQQMNKPDLALQLFDTALKQKPDLGLAWYNRALVLRVLERRDEAWESTQKALRADPSLADAWDMGGNLLREMGMFDESRAHHRRAVALQPDNARYRINYAVSCLAIGDPHDAYKAARKAEQIDPAFLPITMGNVLKAAGYPERAIPYFEKSRPALAGSDEGSTHEAMARLLIGDFEYGLTLFESRPDMDPRYGHIPLWRGEKVRHLLLHEDQGLGDVLQCVRYIPLIRDRAEKITLHVAAFLHKLLQTHFPDIECIPQDAPIPQADRRVRFLSLPYLCGTQLDTIPAVIPYLHADKSWHVPWRERVGSLTSAQPRIGIIWGGNPANRNDRNRSLSFSQIEPLLKTGAGHFISLQKGKQKEQADFSVTKIFDADPFLNDFADTAGLIAELDLLITVDTAAAHLAGAMGKPVWMMTPFDPDWRWMLGREDSPWYPALRLFRQTKPGDWESVVADISDELRKLIDGDRTVLTPKPWAGSPLRQNLHALKLED